MTIRLWDWDKNWANTQTYEGHSHYVMMVAFNPKDANTFASASLDRTIKIWGLGALQPHFTLEGHDKGVNCVDYFSGGDRPYLVSGADDNTVKVWDYQTKQCVQTMEGHTHNVATVCCHPELPIILSGSEDGSIKIWHSTTYRLENTLNYAFERCWSIAALKGTNNVAIGYDEGTIAIQLGNEDPLASMDASGKIILARHNEISLVDLNKMEGEAGRRRAAHADQQGARRVRDLPAVAAAQLQRALRRRDGRRRVHHLHRPRLAQKVVWQRARLCVGARLWEYAVRESPSCIKLFKNFKETRTFKPPFGADALLGGAHVYSCGRGVLLLRLGRVPARAAHRRDAEGHQMERERGLVVIVCRGLLLRAALQSRARERGL